MSITGSAWKKHKYIRIENGKYIYPGDETSGKKQAQDAYRNLKARIKALKSKQLEYENQIADDSIGDKDKTKATYNAGDKLDEILRRLDKANYRMKQQRSAYKKTFGKTMWTDTHTDTKNSTPKTDEEVANRKKELETKLSNLQRQRTVYTKAMNDSTTTANSYYKKSEAHKNKPKSAKYQVNGIVGKKYESVGRRYASKLNLTDRKIEKITKELKRLGKSKINNIVGR